MASLIQETPFKTFTVRELHPTFGAEIQGVDWEHLTDEGLQEIVAAMAKVGEIRLLPSVVHIPRLTPELLLQLWQLPPSHSP